MSDIAQALAKAKARTGHTVTPFTAAGTLSPPRATPHGTSSAAALRRAKTRQRFWMILGVIALPLTGFVLWSQLGAPAVATPAPLHVADQTDTVAAAPFSSPPAAIMAKPPRAAARPTAATEINEEARRRVARLVADLPISAVMPGEPPRIMLSGRVVRAGEAADKDLVFLGVSEGLLQFADASGTIYSRRY